jgi:hypothetical protein
LIETRDDTRNFRYPHFLRRSLFLRPTGVWPRIKSGGRRLPENAAVPQADRRADTRPEKLDRVVNGVERVFRDAAK